MRTLGILGLAVLLLGRGAGADSPETAANHRGKLSWRFEAGGKTYEGALAFVSRAGDKLHIQLVNRDAVNFGVLIPGEGADTRQVEEAFFAVGRGPSCLLVASEPPFQVTFEPGGGEWLSGTFAGMLGCPDYSALPVKGSFHVPAPGQ